MPQRLSLCPAVRHPSFYASPCFAVHAGVWHLCLVVLGQLRCDCSPAAERVRPRSLRPGPPDTHVVPLAGVEVCDDSVRLQGLFLFVF